jgi:hypothetical protein
MRKWIGPDQARPVQDCQSGAQSSPTFRWDRTGLSPTPDRVRPDWWNHCLKATKLVQELDDDYELDPYIDCLCMYITNVNRPRV